MIGRWMLRLFRQADRGLALRFLRQFGMGSNRALSAFRRDARRGRYFPAFLFLSLTTRCNLRCRGCWVTVDGPPTDMAPALADRIIREACARNRRFFGLLGGEPLLYPALPTLLKRNQQAYFQLFTNGTLLTEEAVAMLREAGNVTPLISIEGREEESDRRRGGDGVYGRAIDGLRRCAAAGLVTGVATSVCRSNFDEVVTDAYIRDMMDAGALYVWYYIYRIAGPNPSPELALDEDQILTLRRFLVERRPRYPILLVDAYWDHLGRALCPAAVGISHHINPFGDIEPCPPIQFAADRLRPDVSVADAFEHSEYLRRFRSMASGATRGCILLNRPDLLVKLIGSTGARDTSGRETGTAEIEALPKCACHHLPGRELPEPAGFYRMAKKRWFFGLGAYG